MPVRYHFKRNLLVFPLLCLLFFSLCRAVSGEAADDIAWQTLETKHTIIHYQSREDLEKFDKKIKFGPSQWGVREIYSDPESDDFENRLKTKMDALYVRVQKILDMRKKMKKVTINIYRDREQMNEAHYRLFKKKAKFRSWYVYEKNTVYIGLNDMFAGMLAHEIGHSIIDHYLLVRPPSITAEILARYVDKHLYKK